MIVHSLSNLDELTLSSLIGTDAPVVLIGSGISLWAPSNLPTGVQFTKSVYSMLFNDELGDPIDRNPKILDKYFEKLPFEVINEKCPDTKRIKKLLKGIYNEYDPNPLHELFANLLFDGKIQSVITPNYDCCLDTAISRVFKVPIGVNLGKFIRVVNNHHSIIAKNHHDPIYFKIHGSVDDTSSKSLIFRLNQEGMLKPWKRKLFRNMVRNRTLLVIGYSGSDFDICPEIALAQPKKIIWNFRSWNKKEISPNIKFISERCDLIIINGDMRDLLSRLYYPVTASIGASNLDLDCLLKNTFDDTCKKLWRLRIYNSINYNKSALIEAKLQISQINDKKTIISFLSEQAGASASSGKYHDAAKIHDKAMRIAQNKSMEISILITQTLLACDAWRCYGSFLKSIIRYRMAASLIRDTRNPPPYLFADLDRNFILLIRHPYDLFLKFRLSKVVIKMRNRAATGIARSIEFYRKNGDWYQLQQVGLWRERFNLSEQVSIYNNEYETPLSTEGYRQLNFPMGQMMAFRHTLEKLDRHLNRSEVKKVRELASDAKELGISPEVWKLNMIILRKAQKDQCSLKEIKEFFKAFKSCQYSLLFRIWRLVLGD